MIKEPNKRIDDLEEKSGQRLGRKELLTKNLALRIAKMIELFPDSNIRVTWENVAKQTKSLLGYTFGRNVLSQKSWDGRRLIDEAFQDAKRIQKRHLRDTAPKYSNESRARLRLIVAKLQSENLALKQQLEHTRAQQYEEIFSLLDTRTPLQDLVKFHSK
jgi:hypothetical protein